MFSALLAILLLTWAPEAGAREWEEADFAERSATPYRFEPAGPDVEVSTVIGELRDWQPEKGDTFLDIGRHFDLGLNSMVSANPGIDQWIPWLARKALVVPTEWILPCCRYEGLVVNLPEMRLYYYPSVSEGERPRVYTFPVGLGRQEWRTPKGDFEVVEKARNPTWVIPESIRKERIERDGSSDTSIPGGDPDNPLGAYRIRLSLPAYAIHGTNIPWGVGMSVSHGCVRMYPEDIHLLFPMIPTGTKGEFTYQTVKVGERGERVFVEVHPDLYGYQPGRWRLTMELLEARGLVDRVDEEKLLSALSEKRGYPVDVTRPTDRDKESRQEDTPPPTTASGAVNS